jgi:hypothetical protein
MANFCAATAAAERLTKEIEQQKVLESSTQLIAIREFELERLAASVPLAPPISRRALPRLPA